MTDPPGVPELLDEIERARGQATEVAPAPPRRVLGLQVGDDLYGLDIGGVREIRKVLPVTFVPGAPPTILGVINLRGQMLPVVDLRGLLDLPPPADLPGAAGPNRARLVVVGQDDVTVGLLVEGVTEVYDTTAPVETLLGARAATPLTEGQVAVGDRLLVLLNLPNLIVRLTA